MITMNDIDKADLDMEMPYLTEGQAQERMEDTGRAVHYIDAHTHQPTCIAPEFEREEPLIDHPGMGELDGHPNDDPDEDDED